MSQHITMITPPPASDATRGRVTALGDAKLAKARALLPPPVQPIAQQLLESLPSQLCKQPPAALAALPNAWKDAVCPFGLLASPLAAAKAGLRPWGLVVAAAAFNASLSLDGAGGGGPGVSTMYDGATNKTTTYLVGGSGGGQVEIEGDADAAVAKALAADPKFADAYNQVGPGTRRKGAACAQRALSFASEPDLLGPACSCTPALVTQGPPAHRLAGTRRGVRPITSQNRTARRER